MKRSAFLIAAIFLAVIGAADATTIYGTATQSVGANIPIPNTYTIRVIPGGTVSPSVWSLGTVAGTYTYDPDGAENVQVDCVNPTSCAWTLQVKDNKATPDGRMRLNGNGVPLVNPLQIRRYGGSTISLSGTLQTVATGTGDTSVDIVLSQTTVSADYGPSYYGSYTVPLLWQVTGTF